MPSGLRIVWLTRSPVTALVQVPPGTSHPCTRCRVAAVSPHFPSPVVVACRFRRPPLFRCCRPRGVVVVPRLVGGTHVCTPPLELLPPLPTCIFVVGIVGPRVITPPLFIRRPDNSGGGWEVCWLHHRWSVTSLRPPLVVLPRLPPLAPRAYLSRALVPEGHKSSPARCAGIGARARGGAITLACGRGS